MYDYVWLWIISAFQVRTALYDREISILERIDKIIDQKFERTEQFLVRNFRVQFNPLTTGMVHFWPICFLSLWEIEIAVIFRKYEK